MQTASSSAKTCHMGKGWKGSLLLIADFYPNTERGNEYPCYRESNSETPTICIGLCVIRKDISSSHLKGSDESSEFASSLDILANITSSYATTPTTSFITHLPPLKEHSICLQQLDPSPPLYTVIHRGETERCWPVSLLDRDLVSTRTAVGLLPHQTHREC